MAEEIVNGFKEVGFIYLEDHGIPSSTVDNVLKKVCALVMIQPPGLVEIVALESECGLFPFAVFHQSKRFCCSQNVPADFVRTTAVG
jgi:hypothetical protein